MSKWPQSPLLMLLLALVFLPIGEPSAYEPLVTVGRPALSDILYSPDGRFLATLTSSYLELLDAETYAPVTQADVVAGFWNELAFSPDGSLLAISGVDESIRVWHVDSETFVANIPATANVENVVAFSPDGKYLAYPNDDSVFLWDVERRETVIELTGDPKPSSWYGRLDVRAVAFHPDGKTLAVGSFRNTIALWDIETGEIRSYLEMKFENFPRSMTFSNDGNYLAAMLRYGTSQEPSMRLWNVATGESRYMVGDLRSLAFTPDDQQLLVGGGDGNLYVVQVDTFKSEKIPAVDRLPPPNIHNYNSLARLTFHPDGKRLASLINVSRIRIWDAQDFSRIQTIYGYAYPKSEALYLPESNRIVTGKNTNVLNFWDSRTGELVKAFEFYFPIRHLKASPNGRDIAIEAEMTHQIWDAANAKQTKVFDDVQTGGLVREIGFSPSGKYLASISWMGTFIWDVEKGQKLTWGADDSMGAAYFSCPLLKFTSDEKQMVATRSDLEENQWTALWDVETGELVDEMDYVGPLANVGNDFLQARQVDDTIEIRMLKSDKLICRIPDRQRTLEPCDFFRQKQFHPSGSVLAVRYDMVNRLEGSPWEYRFYDTQNGELISSISKIRDLNFAADGSFMFLVDGQEQLGLYRTSDVIGKSVQSVVSVKPSGKMITLLGRLKRTQLLQNYPNPFNPETWIPYQLAVDSEVTISIYNVTGQVVRTLDIGHRTSGHHSVYWDGKDDSGHILSSGIYFYALRSDDGFSSTRKMTLLQ